MHLTEVGHAKVVESIAVDDPVVRIDIAKVVGDHEGSEFFNSRFILHPTANLSSKGSNLTRGGSLAVGKVHASEFGNP